MDNNLMKLLRDTLVATGKAGCLPLTYSCYLISQLRLIPGVTLIDNWTNASGGDGQFVYKNQAYKVTIEPIKEAVKR